jgi:hypothetical protein
LLALLAWSALAPALIHHDFAGTDLLLAPVVLILLAAIRPARPDLAAAVTFCTFAAVFVLGPLSNRLAGSQYDTQAVPSTAGQADWGKLLVLLGLAAGTALVVAVICVLRRPSARAAQEADNSLVSQLVRLNELHAAGALSDSEFAAAKARLVQDRQGSVRSGAGSHSEDLRL